jgi:hypothetical protein
MEKDRIKINLTKDEAIVLFEFLSRFSDKDELKIEHQAEERALWNLTCYFERELVEPFSENYGQILDAARERLKDDIK